MLDAIYLIQRLIHTPRRKYVRQNYLTHKLTVIADSLRARSDSFARAALTGEIVYSKSSTPFNSHLSKSPQCPFSSSPSSLTQPFPTTFPSTPYLTLSPPPHRPALTLVYRGESYILGIMILSTPYSSLRPVQLLSVFIVPFLGTILP